MSTTVTYKGQTLTTVENQTKTLNTAGTWVEGDFTLTDVTQGGESYEAEFLELKAIIEGTVNSIDNSTIEEFAEGIVYQRKNVNPQVWRELQYVRAGQFYRGATGFVLGVYPKLKKVGYDMFYDCKSLKTLDFGALTTNEGVDNYAFEGCSALETIILRPSHVVRLVNPNAFNGSTFKNGGTGGEIYVPSALIDSYKSATNWSTVDGYGTITWKAIEGSQYENYYADGSEVTA